MTIHELKIWPHYYQPVQDNIKTFEIRKDDRNYKVGDYLALREYNPLTKEYTGRRVVRRVCYALHPDESKGIADDYVVIGLELIGYEPTVAILEGLDAAAKQSNEYSGDGK